MSPDSRIGSALMSRRIELGISLEQAARDTNIRARMIELLESGDYAQYPPRGHAIGMLSSYARYLGLNSARIVEAFDQEFEDFEAGKRISNSANNTRRGVGRFGERASSGKAHPVSRDSSTRRRSGSRRARGSEQEERPSKFSRSLQSEAQAKDDDRYKTGSVRVVGTRHTGSFRSVQAPRSSSTTSSFAAVDPPSYRSRRASSSYSQRGTNDRPYSRSSSYIERPSSEFVDEPKDDKPDFFGVNSGGEGSTTKRRSSRSRTSSRHSKDSDTAAKPDENIIERMIRIVSSIFSERRTRLIALVFAIIVIAIIIAASVLIGTAGNNNSGIIPVQGGITNDTTTTDGKNAAHKTITTANGNPVMLRVEVPEGETSVIDISFDGANAYKGAAVGPWSKDFNVTESFTASIGNPKAVTITENGNPIEVAIEEDGTGSLYINIQSSSH